MGSIDAAHMKISEAKERIAHLEGRLVEKKLELEGRKSEERAWKLVQQLQELAQEKREVEGFLEDRRKELEEAG